MSLVFEDISLTLMGQSVLSGVSLTLRRGELTVLLGPNGAGKSSLLRAGLGLERHATGRALADGDDLPDLDQRTRARRIAYLPQERRFGWPVSVRDAVALGRYAYGGPLGSLRGEDRRAVDAAIAACGLDPLAQRSVDGLSGGEAARVHAARLFAAETPYILADEPAEALDPFHREAVLKLFREAAGRGAGVLLVLHDLDVAARFADRVAVLKAGQVVAEGPPTEVLTPRAIEDVYGVTARCENGRVLIG